MTTDIRCLTHEIRRCTICLPPPPIVGVWVDEGAGDWSRIDADGTRWAVCPDRPGVYTLSMRYRDHRLLSEHPDKEAAMRHADDMVAAFKARTMAAYAVWGTAIHNDDQQLGMEG